VGLDVASLNAAVQDAKEHATQIYLMSDRSGQQIVILTTTWWWQRLGKDWQ
jgi:hypothetical protein